MDIKSVDPTLLVNANPYPQPANQQNASEQSLATQIAPDRVKDEVQVGNKVLQNSFKFMDNMRAVSDEINAYARAVRHTDAVLAKAGSQVELMKKPLEAIIKNFPPFPSDSKEREDLLKSYASLRKEIEKLTVPPPIVSTTALKQMFNDLFDNDGTFKAARTFGLPENIPQDATDRQLIAVIDKLDTAKMQIEQGRVELSTSVK